MSRRNGDRSRFNRLRKQKLHRRTVSSAIASAPGSESTRAAALKSAAKAKK
jgi:hypothetical protein